MWLWILTGFNIIITSHGFSSGNFPQSCASMSPEHRNFQPSKDDPPFYISYDQDAETDPFIVSLLAKNSNTFTGFMLQARTAGGQPVGRFTLIDEGRLLDCNGPASAVSQRNNREKPSFKVQWEPPTGQNKPITFRATFVKSLGVFWENVTLPLNTQPLTTTSTSTKASTPSLTTTSTSTEASTPPLTTTSTSTKASTPPLTTTSTSTEASGTTVSQTAKVETSAPTAVPTSKPYIPAKSNKTVTVLMVVNSVLVVLKMELSYIIISTITNRPFSRRMDQMSKILCHVASEAVEVSSLVLSLSCQHLKDNVFPLLCGVIAINVLVVILTLLPIGPSHELKDVVDIVAKIFSVFHGAFTMACICIGCLEFVDRKHFTEFWTLWVLIVYAMGILLFFAWVVTVFTTHRNSILCCINTGCLRHKRKKKMVMTSISFIGGAVVFAAMLIPGILKLPRK